MMDMADRWFQIEIQDGTGLSGPSAARIIKTIAKAAPRATVIGVAHAEGAAPDFATTFPPDSLREFDVAGLLGTLGDVVQFDWADFYFVGNREDLCGAQEAQYEEVVPRTVATVRAIDDTYYYVYTRDRNVVDRLRSEYPQARHRESTVAELDFPY
jgi:hypothetical protein